MAKNNREYVTPVEENKPVVEERKNIDETELQSYYNDAYIKERERLNAMFGRVDTYPVVQKEVVYKEKEPDYSKYVTMDKYKKESRAVGWLAFFFTVAALAAIALAVIHFIPSVGELLGI